MKTHKCRVCGACLPATTEHFYLAGRYFNWICKPCMIERAGHWKRQRFGWPGSRDVVCERCGLVFVSAKRNARYCTRFCKLEARKAKEKKDRLAVKGDQRRCIRCGEAIPPTMRADAKFCSSSCNAKAHAQGRSFRRRAASHDQRETALISLAAIAERDRWLCGLCGTRVPPGARHPDPRAPSLDHIVPLSRGGTNEASNLQLTHLICNLQKRDSAKNEQLRLLG